MALKPDTLKVYLALRFEADFNHDVSPIKKNVTFIMNKTRLSRRQIFYSFKELEKHGLLLRDSTPGFQSTYWVAEDKDYFNKDSETQNSPVQDVQGGVQDVHGGVHDMHNITINSSINNSKHIINPSIVSLDKKNSITEKQILKPLTPEDLLTENPHQIPEELLREWYTYRKKPVTARVWHGMNKTMGTLGEEGISPLDAFKTMLEGLWQGMKSAYYEQDIKILKERRKSKARPFSLADVMNA
jgi:hypothetical protein